MEKKLVIESRETLHDGPDIPEAVLSLILSRTSPLDVARSSLVNSTFADASRSNSVWGSFLPPCYSQILNASGSTNSKKELFQLLCDHILLQLGTEGLWLDRATGAVCRSLSAKALAVTWGSTQEYWKWITKKGSRFPQVAHVKMVCWLEIIGHWKLSLPPGLYTFSWRLQLDEANYGWGGGRVQFSLSTSDGQATRSHCYLVGKDDTKPSNKPHEKKEKQSVARLRQVNDDGWIECDAGEFRVHRNGGGWQEVELRFCMAETESGRWKGGLYVDCVAVQPSHVLLQKCKATV
eukprot:c13633_g1_i1 orf=175-1053(-)